jgi:hypothetical protein
MIRSNAMTSSLNESIQPKVRTIDGLSVRYAESEQRDDHAILISPWPESVFAYDQMWSRLAENTHLVAIDLTSAPERPCSPPRCTRAGCAAWSSEAAARRSRCS